MSTSHNKHTTKPSAAGEVVPETVLDTDGVITASEHTGCWKWM